MKELETKLERTYKKEADDVLFDKMEFNPMMKQKIRQEIKDKSQTSSTFAAWIAAGRRKWAFGTAAVAMATMIAVSIPMLQDIPASPADNHPDSGITQPGDSSVGSGLSDLITTEVESIAEAEQWFVEDLFVPGYIPAGYELTKLEAVGTKAEEATRVMFTYTSGDQYFNLTEDMSPPGFNMDAFESVEINGREGFINAMPGLTELYWIVDGVTLSIVGPVAEEEAIKVAQSMN